MKKFKELREHSLEEKLKASDPAGKYVSDFVHSDNPKFEGKSKAKRIQMGLAASYAAKGKSRNEEVEELDEISTKTLASAAKSASDPESDYYYGKSHNAQKFADHAKKTKDSKSAAAVQGAADAKGHYPRPGHTVGSYDKLAHRSPARVTSAGKANKQDIKSLKSNLRKEEVESVEEGRNDTPVPYGSLSNRPSFATVAQTGPRKGMITKKHATRLKDRIKASLKNEEVESVEEGIMNAVKNLAKKASKTLTGGSDEDQRKDLQRKIGVPQTGKKPMQK